LIEIIVAFISNTGLNITKIRNL